MTTISPSSDQQSGLFCSSEWHLRDNPCAFLIYALALRVTGGGKTEFFVSQPRLAHYFQLNLKTVKTAFKALRDSGLFVLLRSGRGGDGRGNYASVYRVLTHSQLSRTGEYHCLDDQDGMGPETGSLVSDTTSPENGTDPKLSAHGTVFRQFMGPETGSLVSDKSTRESTSSDAAASDHLPSAPPAPKPKYSHFPSNFAPNEESRALASKLGLNLMESLPAFRDHHLSKGDRSMDWNSAFNGWLRNERKFSRQPQPWVTTGSLTENQQDLVEKYQ